MTNALLWAAGGTGLTCLMTCLGASMVFFVRGKLLQTGQRLFLGFAAGVMVAASVWSLLIPAMEEAALTSSLPPWLPAGGGFLLGALFLLGLDNLLPHLHPGSDCPEGRPCSLGRSWLLVLAVTLHNIPEGMALGLSFALAAQHGDPAGFAGAMALAVGMGIQNFPEGAAISLPLRQEGFSPRRSFLWGALSGVVEPLFGIPVVMAAGLLTPAMPWLLSFAAGAMVYVVVEELIPEAQLGEHSHLGTLGVLAGFLVMMVLDTALG